MDVKKYKIDRLRIQNPFSNIIFQTFHLQWLINPIICKKDIVIYIENHAADVQSKHEKHSLTFNLQMNNVKIGWVVCIYIIPTLTFPGPYYGLLK